LRVLASRERVSLVPSSPGREPPERVSWALASQVLASLVPVPMVGLGEQKKLPVPEHRLPE
jgi:hypothetical protein